VAASERLAVSLTSRNRRDVAKGESYAAIAADLGKSESAVRGRFLRTMERSATVTEEARQLALLRLDHLLYQWWEDATRDPENEDHRAFLRASRATRQVLRILDQENRIQGLYGC
jgi:AraC-like DNA-binding protein